MAALDEGTLKRIVDYMQQQEKAEPAKLKATKTVHVAEIVKHGKQFVMPEGIGYDEAIELLQRRKRYEEEEVEVIETIDCFVWDGALAFFRAMEEMFGFANSESIEQKMFGMTIGHQPPRMIAVETGPGETTNVPWGRFSLPGVEGFVETGAPSRNGRTLFSIRGIVKRKHEAAVKALVELARRKAISESIYRGKAIKVRFRDDDGDRFDLPEPKFLDLSKVDENQCIYSEVVGRSIETNLFTPIVKADACRKYGIPLKRGVLLSGPYGTGKTLAAYVTAAKCVRSGWTFLYCERADELTEMVALAKQYQPAVIFCEDVDRVIQGERSVKMDDILNIIDGIESKSNELMVILTTNHVDKINRAMLRPGRLDAVINVLPPDAQAVERLIRHYGKGLIPENADLSEVGRVLDGKIPAVIRECIERAKLSAIKMSDGDILTITPEALVDAAVGMKNQLDLLDGGKPKDVKDQMAHVLGKSIVNALQFNHSEGGHS